MGWSFSLIHALSEAATIAAQAPTLEEHYFQILFGLGAMILLVAWLPIVLKKLPLSLPIVCVVIGFILFSFEPFSTCDVLPKALPVITGVLGWYGAPRGGVAQPAWQHRRASARQHRYAAAHGCSRLARAAAPSEHGRATRTASR